MTDQMARERERQERRYQVSLSEDKYYPSHGALMQAIRRREKEKEGKNEQK